MCVVSNIGDSYGRPDGWPWKPVTPIFPPQEVPQDFAEVWKKAVENTEILDLRKRVEVLEELLRKAKEYDAATGQPDCELDEKRQALKRIADEMGVPISFP